ncbi:unnamed protein product [Larinioides sclopetarius]|uniref:acetylcholinesterase n=1 Tax=Larinioides sclopetarius TaxID=280406 RepID=A0AAV2B658_9ARAC
MNVLLFLIFCQGIILSVTRGASSCAVVQMGNSQIIGEPIMYGENIVNQYLGIPYAKPPLGDLRFKPTVPLDDFPETYEALYPPPACRQYTEVPFPWYFNDTCMSEDCLYLNIWTPADASPQNLKPVLYFIFGGQFGLGSTKPSFYSGVALSGEGDVIVVTVNYRLGPFGFLYTGTDDAPGNAGLWDILTGLRWVNENIRYFGGDPSQITISGQGSSAVAVGRFTESPVASCLYSKLIMLSESPANLQTEFSDIMIDHSKELAMLVGCATDEQYICDPSVSRCLQSVSADLLERAEFQLAPDRPGYFRPVYGDEINPTNPRRDVFEGNFDCKPLFTGNVRNEGSIFLTTNSRDYFGFYGEKNSPVTRKRALNTTQQLLQVFPDLQASMDSCNPNLDLEFMLENNLYEIPDGSSDCLRYETYTGFGDIGIVCPTVYFAEQCAAQGNDVYYYFFDHRDSDTPFANWMGVTHFSEVQFFFGLPLLYPDDYTPAERKLSKEMVGYWTNFIKYGQPDPKWPKYSKENPIYQVIGGEKDAEKYGQGPHQTDCENFEYAFRNL